MEIRYSPYNSPFVPAGPPGVYWIGAEYRNMPHNAHVYERQRYLGRLHVERLQLEMTSSVALLPMLDEMAADGIRAAARRAKSIRQLLSPNKSEQKLTGRVLAKRSISAQINNRNF